MKRFLLLVFLIPMMVFGQTEREQKQQIRSGSTSQSNPTRPQQQTQPSHEINQKLQIRENSTRNSNFNTTPIYNFPPRRNYGFGPVWYPNRWNRWGAPLDYHHYSDFYFSDRWGYRTPARVYYYKNGGQDTIVSKKSKVRLGLNLSSNKEVGGWFTVGRDVYFKASFNKTFGTDESTFYSNISMDVVQNWVNTNPSQNYKLNDITEGWNVYLGVGREFKHFGANVSLGIGKENNNYQYFDGTYILSNNGKYSFRNFVDDYTTLSIGLTKDIKSLSISTDYDPIRNEFYLGLGFNF